MSGMAGLRTSILTLLFLIVLALTGCQSSNPKAKPPKDKFLGLLDWIDLKLPGYKVDRKSYSQEWKGGWGGEVPRLFLNYGLDSSYQALMESLGDYKVSHVQIQDTMLPGPTYLEDYSFDNEDEVRIFLESEAIKERGAYFDLALEKSNLKGYYFPCRNEVFWLSNHSTGLSDCSHMLILNIQRFWGCEGNGYFRIEF